MQSWETPVVIIFMHSIFPFRAVQSGFYTALFSSLYYFLCGSILPVSQRHRLCGIQVITFLRCK